MAPFVETVEKLLLFRGIKRDNKRVIQHALDHLVIRVQNAYTSMCAIVLEGRSSRDLEEME